MPPEIRPRLRAVTLVFLFIWLFLLGRLSVLQILNGRVYGRKAEAQNEERVTLEAERGHILDRNHQVLATSLEVVSIYALSCEIGNQREVAQKLAGFGLGTEEKILAKLERTRGFCWLRRGISDRIAKAIVKSGIEGVYPCKDRMRYYPRGELAGNLLGFVGEENRGLEGVEYMYDQLMAGTDGWAVLQRHPKGGLYPFPEYPRSPPTRGRDLILTIDATLQEIVENELTKTISACRAQNGLGILMDPQTGEILAMANSPCYNPNLRGRGDPAVWRNRAISDLFEPGSTFKIVMAAAGLGEGVVSPGQVLPMNEGQIEVAGITIKDVRKHGDLTFKEVVWRSSNVGAITIARTVGKAGFYLYSRALGFGCKTGIGLPGEAKGCLPPPQSWSAIRFANLAFGQGLSATALQLALAYSAIANKGILLKPQIVRAVLDGDRVVETFSPQAVRRSLPVDASETLTNILVGVVKKGTGLGARVRGVEIAGKTGTAEKSDERGGYKEGSLIASFVGFFPAQDPAYLLCVVVDEPKVMEWGGEHAAVLFGRIVRRMLRIQPYRDKILPSSNLAGM